MQGNGAGSRLLTPGALVLASASRTRRRLFEDAGIACAADAADLDETALRDESLRHGRSAERAAMDLAQAKAVAVSLRRPKAIVVGADQILECGGAWFEKPRDLAIARETLSALRGRVHALVSAVAVAQGGLCVWRHVDTARMTMRAFSDDFLDYYLDAFADDALDTVAGYRFEGPGAQLFTAVEGDPFTILGMPLLALMVFLRDQAILAQ